jgi:6-phosphogluconolactonase
MRATFALALWAPVVTMALLAVAPLHAADLGGWFGTYTTNQGTASGSVGIYGFQWNTDGGSLHGLHAAAQSPNPSFLALHPNGRFLYAVNEGVVNEGGGSASADRISAFAIGEQGAAGELAPLGSVSSKGKGPCYLIVDATGRWLFAANYQSGTIAVFAIQSDGHLSEAQQTIQQQGTGPVADRQRSAHAHEAVPSPDGRFLLVPDLGADRIFIYHFDAASGALRPNETPAAVMPPGYGPRHLVFSKDAGLVYVVTELADRIITMRWDATAGVLTPLAETSALSANFSGRRSGAEIALHPNGKFLYSSSRGDSNTIAIFRLKADGVPVPAGSVPSGGSTPRFFGIDPSGQYLISLNQDSSNVVIFRIDPDTGMLHSQGVPLAVPAPVDFVFARAHSLTN